MSLNENQYNQVLNNIQSNIPSDCGAYEDIRKKSTTYTGVLGATTFSLSDYEAYRNDIEFVNSFNEQLLVDEKNYLEKKYSPVVYKYLLTQRAAFKDQQARLKEELLCKSHIDALNALQQKYNENATDTGKKDTGDSGRFMNYLLSQTTMENPDTTYKKIEYRKEEHEWLSTINVWMTILYFIMLIALIGLLAASNKLLLGERFLIYLLLVVLPFAFPYLFELLKYLYGYVFPDSPNHGPKNAFLEMKNNVDSFNI